MQEIARVGRVGEDVGVGRRRGMRALSLVSFDLIR